MYVLVKSHRFTYTDLIKTTDPSSAEDFDAYLDRDGKELEELLSEMDLDMDQKMSDA